MIVEDVADTLCSCGGVAAGKAQFAKSMQISSFRSLRWNRVINVP